MREGWTRVAFGDVVRLSRERTSDPLADGLDRYVGLEHLEPGDLKVRRWGNVADGTTFTNVFRAGHVLFGKRRAYQRKVAAAHFSGVCSGDIYVFESIDDVLIPELLPFICQSEEFFRHAVQTSAGSLSPRTKWDDLATFAFDLPPRLEQRRFVALLTAIDDLTRGLIVAREKCAAAREAWMDATLLEMADQVPVLAAPQVLERLTVGIVVKPADLYVPTGTGVPALRSLNVAPGRLVLDEVVEISWQGHRDNEKSKLSSGDVVVVRTGRPGDAAVIDGQLAELNAIDLVICTPGKLMLPGYFCATLNSAFGRRQFTAGTAGTAQKHFNVGAFGSFMLPVPKIAAQERIVAAMSGAEEGVGALNRQIRASEHLRALAMLSAFGS